MQLLELKTLRKQLRQQRRAVTRTQQQHAQQAVLQRLIRLPKFQYAKKVGMYLHAFGEIHTHRIIEYCFVHRQTSVFAHDLQYESTLGVGTNHPTTISSAVALPIIVWGCKNRRTSRGKHISHLDLVLMPLLACDTHGTRIGMGGGYYDRTLASAPQHPYRLGIAHDFQLIHTRLPRENWDQPVDALLTPQHFLQFKRTLKR